jgi:hypothetical protein
VHGSTVSLKHLAQNLPFNKIKVGDETAKSLVTFQAPDWFEPFSRRLAINDLAWHDLQVQVNHYEDFDPWSRLILENMPKVLGLKGQDADAAAPSY